MTTDGSTTATCGHVLADDDDGYTVAVPETYNDFGGHYKAVVFSHVCRSCWKQRQKERSFLTPEEAELWLDTGILPKNFRA